MSGHEEILARGFPAFPARRGGRARGRTWWAGAWADAVEGGSLEADPLKEGRALARSGRLGPVTVSPGRAAAPVYGGDEGTYTVEVLLDVLDDEEWELLWEKLTARPAELEAVLAGELPEDFMEAAEDARVGLLPGADLDASCGCESFDHPCAHAAALCYQLSWLLDDDPFLLLLLRGRDKETALEEVRTAVMLEAMTADPAEADSGDGGDGRDSADGPEGSDSSAGEGSSGAGSPAGGGAPPIASTALTGDEGVDALAALNAEVPPLPAAPPLPEVLRSADEETLSGLGADPMERLTDDAAARARAVLAYALGRSNEPEARLDAWQDTVRIAASADTATVGRLAAASGRGEELPRAARAWSLGGLPGLDALEHTWTPGKQETARLRTVLALGWEEGEFPEYEVRDNHWTFAGHGLQLRQGRDGRWYPYRRQDEAWWPAGEPENDPATALAELLGE